MDKSDIKSSAPSKVQSIFLLLRTENRMGICVVVAVTAPAELVFENFSEKKIIASDGEFFDFEAFGELNTSCKWGVAATGCHFQRTEPCRTVLFTPKIRGFKAVK